MSDVPRTVADAPMHVVIQRSPGIYEIWSRCGHRTCSTHHKLTATCVDEWGAKRIARLLEGDR